MTFSKIDTVQKFFFFCCCKKKSTHKSFGEINVFCNFICQQTKDKEYSLLIYRCVGGYQTSTAPTVDLVVKQVWCLRVSLNFSTIVLIILERETRSTIYVWQIWKQSTELKNNDRALNTTSHVFVQHSTSVSCETLM